jgi:hypothetical protein
MRFLQLLWRVELAAVAALLICSGGMAIAAFVQGWYRTAAGSPPLLSPGSAAWLSFAYTATLGGLPTVLYGAPLYAFARHKGVASWRTVALIGLIPGIALYLFSERERPLAGWYVVCGLAVACITHLLMLRVRRKEA